MISYPEFFMNEGRAILRCINIYNKKEAIFLTSYVPVEMECRGAREVIEVREFFASPASSLTQRETLEKLWAHENFFMLFEHSNRLFYTQYSGDKTYKTYLLFVDIGMTELKTTSSNLEDYLEKKKAIFFQHPKLRKL